MARQFRLGALAPGDVLRVDHDEIGRHEGILHREDGFLAAGRGDRGVHFPLERQPSVETPPEIVDDIRPAGERIARARILHGGDMAVRILHRRVVVVDEDEIAAVPPPRVGGYGNAEKLSPGLLLLFAQGLFGFLAARDVAEGGEDRLFAPEPDHLPDHGEPDEGAAWKDRPELGALSRLLPGETLPQPIEDHGEIVGIHEREKLPLVHPRQFIECPSDDPFHRRIGEEEAERMVADDDDPLGELLDELSRHRLGPLEFLLGPFPVGDVPAVDGDPLDGPRLAEDGIVAGAEVTPVPFVVDEDRPPLLDGPAGGPRTRFADLRREMREQVVHLSANNFLPGPADHPEGGIADLHDPQVGRDEKGDVPRRVEERPDHVPLLREGNPVSGARRFPRRTSPAGRVVLPGHVLPPGPLRLRRCRRIDPRRCRRAADRRTATFAWYYVRSWRKRGKGESRFILTRPCPWTKG